MICQVTFERSAVDLPWFLTVASMVAVMVPCGVQTALPFIELITRSGSASTAMIGPLGGVVEDWAKAGWAPARQSASDSKRRNAWKGDIAEPRALWVPRLCHANADAVTRAGSPPAR